jgi:hypothetical protein
LDAAKQIDADIRSGAGREADPPDDQVSWNFRRTWRRGSVGVKENFGSDYDYFQKVSLEALDLVQRWVVQDDPDWLGAKWYGSPSVSYGESFAIWQNGVKVSWGMSLEGPQIDIGPTVDYGIFLERWLGTERTNVRLIERVGAMHAAARWLRRKWKGVHFIKVSPIEPTRSYAVSRPGRPKPVMKFPVIRILPRHYK